MSRAAIIRTVTVYAFGQPVANFHKGNTSTTVAAMHTAIRRRNLKKVRRRFLIFKSLLELNYSSLIASAGQDATQVPQEMHFSWSITRASSFSEIASTGQSGSQAPQFTQASVILNIQFSLNKSCNIKIIHHNCKYCNVDYSIVLLSYDKIRDCFIY